MTTTERTQKILTIIATRGWFSGEIYQSEARALYTAGLIKQDIRYSVGGNRKLVWVAA